MAQKGTFWETAGPAAKPQDPLFSLHPPNADLEHGLGAVEVAVSLGLSAAPGAFFPSLPREGSTQEVPVYRTLSTADLYIPDKHATYLYEGSEGCQQCGAGGTAWVGTVEWVAPAQHPHSLFSKGSSFSKLISTDWVLTHVPSSALEQPDSPADTIVSATAGDRVSTSRSRAAANAQCLFRDTGTASTAPGPFAHLGLITLAKEIKTKLGTLLQKPDCTIDFIIPYPEKQEKPLKAQKPSPEEALQWRDSLEKLLQNPYGLASFCSFLRSEFSEENAEFWVACEEYKKIKSPVKMAEKAKKIYEEFIQTEAPKEVNIDHFTKAVTIKNLVEPSPSSFDMAQKRIFALMEKDSLPRFVRSEFYHELIK
ncbi:hypothetical protein Nmel_011098 [Mimus melanotis]